jgi:maltose O-acetyltransferase
MAIAPPRAERERSGQVDRIRHVIREEFDALHPAVLLGSAVARLLPKYVGNRLRAAILRRAGWSIGRYSTLGGVPTFAGSGSIQRRLSIGERTWVNVGCFFELHDEIRIGDGVAIGHDVLFLTSSHQIGPHDWRAGKRTTGPITVHSGVWIGARSVILPGVTLGAGSVVAAGSIVNRDIDPDTLVGGVPAKVVKRLPS